MELSETRGGEMQKGGPGEMASSLKSESMLLIHVGSYGLFSAASRGSWCRRSVLSSFIGPGMQVMVMGVYFASSTMLSQAFLACGGTSRTRKSVHWLLSQRPG